MAIPRYRFRTRLKVNRAEKDPDGRVSTVSFARYFESARTKFFEHLAREHAYRHPAGTALFMTSVNLHYRQAVSFPARLELTVGVLRADRRSLELGCSMWDDQDQCIANRFASHVWIDLKRGRVSRMPAPFGLVAGTLIEE